MTTQFEVSQIKHILERLAEFFPIKAVIAYIFVFVSALMDGSRQIIATIFILLLIDTLTGSYLAIRNSIRNRRGEYNGPASGLFSSRGLYRGPLKFTVYFIFILVSRLVDAHIPLPFASPIIDCFLVTTEAYSIFENFAKMGFMAPTALLEKLKGLQKKSE